MKNLLRLRHTVRRHWQEDPVAFTQNLLRRYGRPCHRAVLHRANAASLLPAGSPLAAHLALLAGDRTGANTHLNAASRTKQTGRSAKYLADIALAAGKPEQASAFADRIPVALPGAHTTRARILWHEGHMSQAIECLSTQSAGVQGLKASYVAERDVFFGWKPRLRPVSSYTPRRRVVVHLLTNSLPHTHTGYTQRTQSMLSAQADAGWEVHAATRLGFPQTQGIGNVPALETVGNVTYHRLPLEGRLPNQRDRLQCEAERLLQLVLELRPQVLHTTTHFINALVVEAVAAAVGIPWAYEVRGQLADTWASKRGAGATHSERYLAWNQREDDAVRAASLVLTLGEAMRARIVKAGVDAASVVLVPNAVGRDYLEAAVDPASARVGLGLPPEGTYVGTVSSIVAYEGLDDLVEAFGLLQEGHPDARLLIVGNGPELPRLRERIRHLGLEEKAYFPGRVPRDQAVRYHQALDVFVVPRKDYPVTRSVTPLKPVEAMAMSRPVVASDLPALREIVLDQETGLLAKAGDPADLARMIGILLDAPVRRAGFGALGRKIVLSGRTWDANAARMLEAYHRLLLPTRPLNGAS